MYLFSWPRLINSSFTMKFVPAFCWQLLVGDFRFLGQDNEKPRDWGLGQWLIYLSRQLCLSSWEGLLQERTKLDLQKGLFPWRGRGRRRKRGPDKGTWAIDGQSVAFLEPLGDHCYLEGEV